MDDNSRLGRRPMSQGSSPLVALLTRLTRLPNVVAAALTTSEGLPVASAGESAELSELRSATVAAIFGAVDRALPGLALGQVHAATIETTIYTVHLRGLGRLVLSAIAERGADRAAVDAEMVRVADVLARVRGVDGTDARDRQAGRGRARPNR
jgi:predicted regulator of Ras-like GTPase activity (Roadblock/LC7/MglB family)